MVDALDANDGLRTRRAGVVAGPFAERAFGLDVVWLHEALDDDFGVSGERQAGGLALADFDRRTLESAGVVEFRHAVVDLVAGNHEEHRVLADADDDGARLALLEPLTALDRAVLSGRDVKPHAVLIVHHAAVGAEIDPTFVRVLGDDETRG